MNLKLAYEPKHPSSQSSSRCLQNEVTRSMPISPMMGCQVITKVTANVILDYWDCSTPPPTFFEVSKKVLWHPFKNLGGGRHLGDLSPELFCNICREAIARLKFSLGAEEYLGVHLLLSVFSILIHLLLLI